MVPMAEQTSTRRAQGIASPSRCSSLLLSPRRTGRGGRAFEGLDGARRSPTTARPMARGWAQSCYPRGTPHRTRQRNRAIADDACIVDSRRRQSHTRTSEYTTSRSRDERCAHECLKIEMRNLVRLRESKALCYSQAMLESHLVAVVSSWSQLSSLPLGRADADPSAATLAKARRLCRRRLALMLAVRMVQ